MLSNLIVIPLAVIILYLGILTLSFSFVLLLDDILAFCLKYSIQFLNYSVNFIDQLPYSLSENIRFGILDTWLAYLFIISIVGLIAYRKFKYIILGATFLSLFLIARLWFNYTHLNQRKFIIYNIPKHTAIDFIDVSEHILITNKSLIENDKKIQFHLQNNWIANGLAKKKVVELNQHMNLLAIHNKNLLIRNSFFQFYEIRIALIHQLFKRNKTKKKIHVDFLILTKNNQLSIAEILTHFSAKQVIIDASHSSYKNNILVKEAHQLKVNCWSVLSQGAFQYTLK
jgi:competence protein ComEC